MGDHIFPHLHVEKENASNSEFQHQVISDAYVLGTIVSKQSLPSASEVNKLYNQLPNCKIGESGWQNEQSKPWEPARIWKLAPQTSDQAPADTLNIISNYRPSARPGHHFEVNPNTGRVEERPDLKTLEYRPERDGYNDGRPLYQVDPNTGAIVARPAIQTAEWRSDRDGWMNRKEHYHLNPQTGQIELTPNITLLRSSKYFSY